MVLTLQINLADKREPWIGARVRCCDTRTGNVHLVPFKSDFVAAQGS